jgi:hypothetical protein
MRLLKRLAWVFGATLVVDLIGTVAVYYLERNAQGTQIQRGDRQEEGEPLARLTASARQLILDGTRIKATRGEQHVAVEPEIRDLLDHALVRLV